MQLRPSSELLAKLFDRYDLDGSGTLNSRNEIQQLTIHLMMKCVMRVQAVAALRSWD